MPDVTILDEWFGGYHRNVRRGVRLPAPPSPVSPERTKGPGRGGRGGVEMMISTEQILLILVAASLLCGAATMLVQIDHARAVSKLRAEYHQRNQAICAAYAALPHPGGRSGGAG